MEKTITLVAEKRNPSKQENRALQNERKVLAVVYGYKMDPMPIAVDASDVLRAYRQVGSSALIDLEIEGKKTTVILKEVSLHPVRHEISHVDFLAVNLKEKSTVNVDLEFVGESEAVNNLGGVFVSIHKNIDVNCLPADSPKSFEIDKAKLKEIGDQITVADLEIDRKKYEIIGLEDDEVICLVNARQVEEPSAEESAEDSESGEAENAEPTEEKE